MTNALAIKASDFQYIDDCIEILNELINIRKMSGVVIILNKATRDFSLYLEQRGVNPKKIIFIDCISILAGLGSPPIPQCVSLNRPNEYENILFYTLRSLKYLGSGKHFVLFVSSRMFLDFDDFNEVGVFFNTFIKRMREDGVLCIVAMQMDANLQFESMIGNLVDSTEMFEDWLTGVVIA